MSISIRQAEINDSKSIAKLSAQLGYKTEHDLMQIRLNNILKNHDNCVFVALENEEVIGWIHGFYSMRVESDPFTEIGGLVVDEKYRGKGVGRILVEKIYNWADSKGCKKVRVRCNVIRKETHNFYAKMGFELNKEQKIFDKLIF